ncbi:MAG: penicillin-binding protein 2 [Clostridia bacterium]|nr:penicillin-binding protein 2 [Clostridia bacterium]
MYKRVSISFFGLMLIFGFLIVNLGVIGLNLNTSTSSQKTNEKSFVISTSRGMIYDCKGRRLVNNDSQNITVCLPTTNAFNTISKVLTDEEKSKIYENMSNGKTSVFYTTQKFSENDICSTDIVTRYSSNQPCVHLIGHLDETGKGAMGLEKAYENYLSQQSGKLSAKWYTDALGHILLGESIKFKKDNYLSPAGIQLTIDLDIQRIAENALFHQNIEKGACVVLDADTCEILASASIPEFNPLDLSKSLTNDDSPFLNRVLTPYSVGSVFKPFVASVALECNIDFEYNCTGSIDVNGTVFRCHNSVAHGYSTLKSAMENSCNTYFIALGQKLGAENLLKLCSSLGFGKSIELADNFNLKSGILPSVESITSQQALANLCFGQGEMLISPVQMAVAYACFANGGYYREPTLMKGIIDKNGNIIQKVNLPSKYRVLNDSTIKQIDNILESVVANGNANKAHSKIVINHGKTATAQSGWFENGREITHTWFCGYFSDNNKTYVIVIFKEDGTSGATDCAPVFKEISENIVNIV